MLSFGNFLNQSLIQMESVIKCQSKLKPYMYMKTEISLASMTSECTVEFGSCLGWVSVLHRLKKFYSDTSHISSHLLRSKNGNLFKIKFWRNRLSCDIPWIGGQMYSRIVAVHRPRPPVSVQRWPPADKTGISYHDHWHGMAWTQGNTLATAFALGKQPLQQLQE